MKSNLGNVFAILDEWHKKPTDDVHATLMAFGEILKELLPLRESLTEILKAEEQNYDTAKAMPTPSRDVDKGDLLSRSYLSSYTKPSNMDATKCCLTWMG